jgi:trans-2,3-dihydro-3-hydroxyanthranilate isomerase
VRLRLTWLDVFTSRPLAGNGLAVVHDADGLDDPTMLAFARETRLSETTFVQRATVSGADYRNRIWTTTGELDFAGHPSLGTAVAVALVRGERTARYVQQTRAGLQPVEVQLDGTTARASMLQEPARFGPEPDAALVLDALGLGPEDAHADLPPQVVSTGVPQVLVPVGEPAALERLRPRAPAVLALLHEHRAVVAYVVAMDPDGDGRVLARSFMEGRGGQAAEDPATGSAAGPLCAYLHERLGLDHIEILQGVAMGRPSVLRCAAGERVRVEGDAVVVAEADLHL